MQRNGTQNKIFAALLTMLIASNVMHLTNGMISKESAALQVILLVNNVFSERAIGMQFKTIAVMSVK